jgi:hypothetical protein
MPNYEELERRIFGAILGFPERIDEMETRSEENCRRLASRIMSLVQEEFGPKAGRGRDPDARRPRKP